MTINVLYGRHYYCHGNLEIIIKTPVTITKDPGYDYKMLVTH